MRNSQKGTFAAVFAATMATIFVGVMILFVAQYFGAITIRTQGHESASAAQGESSPSALALVCEVSQLTPVNGFDAPAAGQRRTLVAGVDISAKTGWYQGEFVISEGRKGSLDVTPESFTFSRPAMFERYGEMLVSEQVTIDRTTGELNQSLTLRGGRTVKLVRGVCARLIRAPF